MRSEEERLVELIVKFLIFVVLVGYTLEMLGCPQKRTVCC